MNPKSYLTLGIFLLISLNFVFVSAHGEETFAEAEEIIMQKVSCDDLIEDQLEILGDYYMEQMHPGELHEIMDERMGGEGSESLRLAHINMGLSFYCGEHDEFSGSMMNTMTGRTGFQYSMMSGYQNNSFMWILNILLIIGLVLLIIYLVRNTKRKRR